MQSLHNLEPFVCALEETTTTITQQRETSIERCVNIKKIKILCRMILVPHKYVLVVCRVSVDPLYFVQREYYNSTRVPTVAGGSKCGFLIYL